MQSKRKGSRRLPQKATTTITETVRLPQLPRKTRKGPSRRTARGPRAFQQPNPRVKFQAPKIRTTNKGDVAIVPGNDLIATIAAGETKISAGDVLVNVIINPEEMKVPRLSTLSRLYRRYRITSMRFEYEPTATIQPGSLLGFVEYDSFELPTGGTPLERLQYARATYGEKGVNITNAGSWNVVPMKDSLFVHQDLTTTSHWHQYARFVIYANSEIAPETPCGSVVVKYSIEFSHPTYESPPTLVSSPPLGYGFRKDYSFSEGKITGTTVFDVSDLKVTVGPDPSSGCIIPLSLPYDSKEPANNYFMINSFYDHNAGGNVIDHSSVSGMTVVHYVRGISGTTTYPTGYYLVQTTNATNSISIGNAGWGVAGSLFFLITRAPPWTLEISKKNDLKRYVSVSDQVIVPSYSQSTSSLGSGSMSSTAPPTPQNSPSVSSGWFRS